MPQVRKLSGIEAQELERGAPADRAAIIAQYDGLLAPFEVGEYGCATPEAGETPLAVRRRLTAAAVRRGWALRWVPGEAGLVFEVQASG
jgi:hypothetical protein